MKISINAEKTFANFQYPTLKEISLQTMIRRNISQSDKRFSPTTRTKKGYSFLSHLLTIVLEDPVCNRRKRNKWYQVCKGRNKLLLFTDVELYM